LKTVESEFDNRFTADTGIILHVVGLFLNLSENGLYLKTKETILEESRQYIDDLKNENKLAYLPNSNSILETLSDNILGGYLGLGYQGKELEEFKEFSVYIDTALQRQVAESIPVIVKDLLENLSNNPAEFSKSLSQWNSPSSSHFESKHHSSPILQNIPPSDFLNRIQQLPYIDQQYILFSLTKRYEPINIYPDLLKELEWLKNVRLIFSEESRKRTGSLSGYLLEQLNVQYLEKIISSLETHAQESIRYKN